MAINLKHMSPDIISLPQAPACEALQEHYVVAESVAEKYRNMQPNNRLHDEIDAAASRALIKACNHYGVANLTNGLIAVCVKNAILSTLTKKANSVVLPLEPWAMENTQADAWDEALGTDDIVDLKRQSELLTKILEGSLLSDTQRRIITLMRSEEEYDQYQIAEMVGVQQPAVSKSLKSAIEKLRDAVGANLPIAA